jgi:hypothetical protein
MPFNTGIQALQDVLDSEAARVEAIKASTGRLDYFTWKPGDKMILRFLTDDMVSADFYNFVITKKGTPQSFMINPDNPDYLRKYQSPSPGIGWTRKYKSEELIQPKPRPQTANIAVLRVEVPDPTDRSRLMLTDAIEDKTIDNTVFKARKFGVVVAPSDSLWNSLKNSCISRFGTLTDRDYEITRIPTERGTNYSVIPLSPVPELDSAEKVAAAYFYGQPWNSEDPERFMKCPKTTLDWAQEYSGEERYKFWLTPDSAESAAVPAPPATAPVTAGGGLGEFAQSTTSNPDEAQAAPVTNFSSLAETLLHQNPQQ